MRNTNAKCCWPPIIELEMILVLHPISIDKKTSSKMAGGERLPCPVALRLTNHFQRVSEKPKIWRMRKDFDSNYWPVYRHFYTHTHIQHLFN
jgi:hypothetical protein